MANQILLAVLLVAAVHAAPQDAKTLLRQGVALEQQNQFKAAIDVFTQAIALDPKLVDAYHRRASSKRSLGDLRGAAADLDIAVAIGPASAALYYGRGLVREELENYPGALADYGRAIEKDSGYFQAYVHRGLVQEDLGEYASGIADYTKALALTPDRDWAVSAYNGRGYAKRRLNDLTGAIADFDRAIALDPNYDLAYVNRGVAKSRLKDAAGAIVDFTKSIEINSRYAPAWRDRGLAKLSLRDYPGGLADVDKALTMTPRDVDALVGRGYALAGMGNPAAALAVFQQALEIDPTDETAKTNLAIMQARVAAAPATAAVKPAPAAAAKPSVTPTPPARSTPPPSPPATRSTPPPPLQASAPVPSIQFKADAPCAAGNVVSAGTPWQKSAASAGRIPSAQSGGAILPAPLQFDALLREQYAGAVSAAHEGMRLIYGPMSDADTASFEGIWAPLFDFPSPAIVNYLNTLNPLLLQFLAGREAMMRAAAAYEAAVLDASLAIAADQRTGWGDAMAVADQQAETMRALEAGLVEIARRVEALGNPPSPTDAKCGARKNHQAALDAVTVSSTMEGVFSGSVSVQKPESPSPGAFNVYETVETMARLAPGTINRILSDLDAAPKPYFLLLRVPPRPASADFGALSRWGSSRDLFVGYFKDALLNFFVEDASSRVSFDDVEVDGDTLTFTEPVTKARVVLRRGGQHASFSDEWSRAFGQLNSTAARVRSVADAADMNASITLNADIGFRMLMDIPAGINASLKTYTSDARAIASAADRYLSSPSPQTASWNRFSDFNSLYHSAAAVAPRPPPPTPPPGTATDSAAVRAAAAADRAKDVAFHQTNLIFLERALQSERADLARETNDDRRKVLALRIIQVHSDISAEQDLIASYQTGTIVHTRSLFDEFAHQQFVASVQQEAARADATRRIVSGIARQIELLPEDQRAGMRANAQRILDAKTIATGDVEKARRLAGAINEQLQGYWQGQSAREEEKAVAAQEHEFYAQTAVMALGSVFVGTGSAALAQTFGETAAITIWGPHLVGGVYGGVTGLVSGGPVEGLKQTVAWSSNMGYMATAFLEGYHAAGANPKAGMSDRLWEGAKELGAAYITGKAFEFGTGLLNHGALAVFGKDSRLFKPLVSGAPTVRQQFDAARTKQQFEDASSLIKVYQNKELQLARLKPGTAPSTPELRQLETELQGLAASINSSYHCKWLMKYEAHPLVRTKFNSRVEQSYQDMMPEMTRILKSQNYEMQGVEFQPMRNASSAGSSSMDLDLALKEIPGMVFKKDGKSVSLHEFMVDAQKALNRAYNKVTGFSAERSEVLLTTSLHPEAFTDKRLLEKNVDFTTIKPQDIANIGSVLQVKTSKIAGDPVLSNITKAQASCRESAKELENMLLPNLRQRLQKAPAGSPEAAKLKASLDHWEKVQKTFKQIGTNETDPYEILKLERQLRQDTGGLGINETIGELSRRFEKLGAGK